MLDFVGYRYESSKHPRMWARQFDQAFVHTSAE